MNTSSSTQWSSHGRDFFIGSWLCADGSSQLVFGESAFRLAFAMNGDGSSYHVFNWAMGWALMPALFGTAMGLVHRISYGAQGKGARMEVFKAMLGVLA